MYLWRSLLGVTALVVGALLVKFLPVAGVGLGLLGGGVLVLAEIASELYRPLLESEMQFMDSVPLLVELVLVAVIAALLSTVLSSPLSMIARGVSVFAIALFISSLGMCVAWLSPPQTR